MVGLGRVVISRRERIVMLEPFDNGLMATTLRYAYEKHDDAVLATGVLKVALGDLRFLKKQYY